MKVSVFGSGYVGLVLAACLAEVGHTITCIDVDKDKIAKLNNGEVPIYEPGLAELIQLSKKNGNINFTTTTESLTSAEIIFIAVGTPQDEDGSADLKYVLQVASTIGQTISDYTIIVDKSTVPVGTADKVRSTVEAKLVERGINPQFDVVSNPEFLKEGAALEDFRRPDRIVVGTDSARAEKAMRELYAPYTRNHDCMIVMDPRSAELTKYAANAMLATKISFMNQMANIADRVGADIEHVRVGIGSDPRIGYHFIYPGCGYGGSCFGKDVQAIIRTAEEHGADASILQSVEALNKEQKKLPFNKLNMHFDGNLKDKTIAVWGLSFKPGTDDMRDAPSRVLIEKLWEQGAKVQAYDPQAMNEARRIWGERKDLSLSPSAENALEGADALVVLTEWRNFRAPDFALVKKKLKSPVLVDARNMYNPVDMAALGFVHYGVGRGTNRVLAKDPILASQKVPEEG